VGDELYDAVAPVVESLGLELVDLELRPGIVRVVVDTDGGVDLDAVSNATRLVSGVLDVNDPMDGRYTLEVSSPGLERQLKTQSQWKRAVGEEVTLRTLAESGLDRRIKGTLEAADSDGVVVSGGDAGVGVRIAYADIERARTVFEWGSQPPPGTKPGHRSTKRSHVGPGEKQQKDKRAGSKSGKKSPKNTAKPDEEKIDTKVAAS